MTTTKNNEHKKLNAPNLRFPEFEGEWTEHTLGDISEFSKERLNSKELSCDNYVATENMLQDYQGIVTASNIPSNTNVMKFSKGDVLLSNIRPYLKKVWYADRDGGCSADVFVFKALAVCDTDFLHYIIANDRFINFTMSGAKGVKMPRGDKEQMKTYKIGLPSKEEQRKIANLLRLLDERIATQNKVIEDLKKLKCAIAERLFKVTIGDVIALSEVCNIQKGKQVNGDCLSETGAYYVMNGGTEPSGYYEQYNAPADTISISEGGNSCGYVQYNREAFWSGGHCYTLTDIQSDVCNLYLYHYLKSKESTIMKLRIGTGLPNIQKKDLEKVAVLLPPVAKQVRISTFLNAIECKTTNEGILLNYFQEEKQYLLRQMFI